MPLRDIAFVVCTLVAAAGVGLQSRGQAVVGATWIAIGVVGWVTVWFCFG